MVKFFFKPTLRSMEQLTICMVVVVYRDDSSFIIIIENLGVSCQGHENVFKMNEND